ncbi:hypothetical protein [Gemmobacter denitrificans]|uniref:Uncharacterized protein n=1 Tax=Gemmobacter denitrificans TaxID=3123040 RepID=A0ABU8BXT7_9RHOB
MRLSKKPGPAAAKPETREDSLAYYTPEPDTRPLRELTALDQMYAYYTPDR